MRKFIEYTIEEGDDKGKIFIITRMSAYHADVWARRFIRALAEINQNINPEEFQLGIADLSEMDFGLIYKFKEAETEALLSDLLACCTTHYNPYHPVSLPGPISEMDLENPLLLGALRRKAFEFNVNFFKARRLPKLPSRSRSNAGGDEGGKEAVKLVEYVNLSRPLGDVLSAEPSLLEPLQTIYDSEDLWLMWEALIVSRHNHASL